MEVEISFRSIITQEEHNHHSGVSSQRNKMSIRTSIVRSISTYYEHPSAGATKTKRRCRAFLSLRQEHHSITQDSAPRVEQHTQDHHSGAASPRPRSRNSITQEHPHSRAASIKSSLLRSITSRASSRSIQHS
jgi:hypothetical protein